MNGLFDRYDRFQSDAVKCITEDFSVKPSGRFLLVVPTGGGKTFTAVKAINDLFENNILSSGQDRVAWVVHRIELIGQAKGTFERFEALHPKRRSCLANVDFLMLSQVRDYFDQCTHTPIAVIDEAHHGAANSYQSIFNRNDIGILGLTATPTRHDGLPLDFERESYSIGFPDLVDLGVVLRPTVRSVEGGKYLIETIDDQDNLEKLNNRRRNERIIRAIESQFDDYRKVIIYVGTRSHVIDLYDQIRSSDLVNHYESIAWITGNGNSRNDDRAEFLEKERSFVRSILINIQVLSEGYDDPSINTIVMAMPTKSKLVYMQAIGRGIRRDPNDETKRAYVVEVTDELPNIRYRIDNRWLYSEISDALEPNVLDREYGSERELYGHLEQIYNEFNVPVEYRDKWGFKERDRYSLLLFKVYRGPGDHFHFPILISGENRPAVSNAYNFLSERMRNFVQKQINCEAAFRMIEVSSISELGSPKTRRYVFDAMSNAASDDDNLMNEGSWITFVAFRFHRDEDTISAEILDFIAEMVNRDEIIERIKSGAYKQVSFLIRLPLPLGSYIGKIVPKDEFTSISRSISQLHGIKDSASHLDNRKAVEEILDHKVIAIEAAYRESLVLIVRDNLAYSLELT